MAEWGLDYEHKLWVMSDKDFISSNLTRNICVHLYIMLWNHPSIHPSISCGSSLKLRHSALPHPAYSNRLLSIWRRSSSTLSPCWMFLILIPLILHPATLWRKLISAACFYDLILSVTTQSLWMVICFLYLKQNKTKHNISYAELNHTWCQ